MEWSIQELVKLSGVTSRALRHYDGVGLLPPCRTGPGGQRFYDEDSLLRLQRILLMRGLGIGLTTIEEVLSGRVGHLDALAQHEHLLLRERDRLDSRLRAIRMTMTALRKEHDMSNISDVADHMFDGFEEFDYRQYEEEVRERWGEDAAKRSAEWWNSRSSDEQRSFMEEHRRLQDAYDAAITEGLTPSSPEVQKLAAAHHAWISAGWNGSWPSADALRGLADMYVADPRFARNYTRQHEHGAEFVREALHVYAAEQL